MVLKELTVEERLKREPRYTECINFLLANLKDEHWKCLAMLIGIHPPVTTDDKIDVLYRILIPIF